MATKRSGSLSAWRRQAIRRMEQTRQATLAFVATLPRREILRPRTQDRWSVKDVLAHLLSCDEETVRRFRLIERGRGDQIRWFRDMADADRFNAASVARKRGLGLPATLRRLRTVHADLVERLLRLPASALRDPSHEWTVVEWLPAPGWSHEQEHVSEIRAWWRGRRPASAERPPRRRTARRG